MIVNQATLTGMATEFRGIFESRLSEAPAFDIMPFVTDVPTTAATVDYDYLRGIPMMRKWIGDKVMKNATGKHFTVTSDEYEATLLVKRRDIETDQLGIYKPFIQQMADEANMHKARLFASVLEANPLCIDGQNLIDTDHPKDDGTTYSNKGTTALTADATGRAALQTARTAMRRFTDAEGRLLGVRPTHLIVPPELEDIATQLLFSPSIPGSANNDINPIAKWGLNLVVDPDLTDTTNWYLKDLSKAVKALFFQRRKAATFVSQEEGSEMAFLRGEYAYSVEADYTIAAGFPHLVYGSIVAG